VCVPCLRAHTHTGRDEFDLRRAEGFRCARVCQRDRTRERKCVCVCVCARVCRCVSCLAAKAETDELDLRRADVSDVCVCERESERKCVLVCVCVRMCVFCLAAKAERDVQICGVSFAEYSLFYRALLQKRPIILRRTLKQKEMCRRRD